MKETDTRHFQATEVRQILDRFEEQNWDRHTTDAYENIEAFAENVVEEGTFTPDSHVTADLNLTVKERLTGHREQDMTALLIIGMMLGAALERDVPIDSEREEHWKNQRFGLPNGEL